MTNAPASHPRFGEPTAVGTLRSAHRGLVIEDLDSLPDGGTALLTVCVVSTPAGTSAVPADLR